MFPRPSLTMPTISSSSAFRTSNGHFSLALRARHVLVAGTTSENIRVIKGRLPEGVDVILATDLVIALSGVVDAVKISGHVIQQSAVAEHVVNYLRVNAGQLGLSRVSNIYVDDEDGRAKFSLSSSRPLRAATEMACLRLASIDVELVCKMVVRGETNTLEATTLFSGQVYLPLFSALRVVLEKFVSNDLVRRYPLIFGPWREKLDAEARLYPSLSRSLKNIACSSLNPAFKKRFRRVVMALGTQRTNRALHITDSLRNHLGYGARDDDVRQTSTEDDSDLLSYSLERLFRRGVRPIVFKGVDVTAKTVHEDDEDEDVRIFDPPGRASGTESIVGDPLDDGEAVDLWSTSGDEHRLEWDSDEENVRSWVNLGCSVYKSLVDSSDEDNLDYTDMWDEENGWHDSKSHSRSPSSASLVCGARIPSSPASLSFTSTLNGDECNAIRSLHHDETMPETISSATWPGSSQQSSQSDEEVASPYETRFNVLSTPHALEHHTDQATNPMEPFCTDRDLLFLDLGDDDGLFSDDAASLSGKTAHGALLSANGFDCDGSVFMNFDEDGYPYDGDFDNELLDG
ncbi:hypothetical protein DAEQUDRAFT_808018 [Daedalea quercina L-15889]|uniref:Uncharacterized protein n=1 Tax=Daedalea quercina L-15889 TaxID=1314783 RepID=A0A165TRI9_9APHY|nr:hypothetical protein DAEQUDRAFT_808018 [Daedalea quercina L-15889]